MTPSCSQANIFPVRPNPVATSSAIIRILYFVHNSLTPLRYLGGDVIIPPAACIIGSIIIAAISFEFVLNMSSNLQRHAKVQSGYDFQSSHLKQKGNGAL